MDEDKSKLIDKIDINNNNLLKIIDYLQLIIKTSNNKVIKGIENEIVKMNDIINKNIKNTESIKNDILLMKNQVNKANKKNKTLIINFF